MTRYPFGSADANALSDPRASAIVEDARGNLWIGTVGGGLNLLDRRTGRFHHYRRNDRDPSSLSDDTVYALHVDRHGELWVGTAGGGLDRVIGSSDAPRCGALREPVGPGRHAEPGRVRHRVGRRRPPVAQHEQWPGASRSAHAHSIKLFHEAHGLQAEDFNFNAHYRGRDGTLYFGGNNGFNAFAPDAVDRATRRRRASC